MASKHQMSGGKDVDRKEINAGHSRPTQRPQGPVIRPVTEADFEAIMGIENSCFPGELAYSRRQMRYLLFKANSTTLIGEEEGQITGYVTALFRKGSGVAGIETIGVSPSFRGLGMGKRLLSAAEESMAAKGAKVSRLEVSAGNAAAVAMYRKAGYDITGAIPGYYTHEHDGSRDAYRMEKAIGDCRFVNFKFINCCH